MDTFEVVRGLGSVERVSNLYPQTGMPLLNFVFFLCPRMKASGFKLNRNKTGLVIEYVKGNSKSTEERMEKVRVFTKEAREAGIDFTITAIFASGDALILFPFPVLPPPLPRVDCAVVSNYELVRNNFTRFVELYYNKSWEKAPARVWRRESERLRSFLPMNFPENIVQDFIERIFAGFALDGLLIRSGYFGANPVILGVETSGVSVLQNAALPREKWLPVIQLV